MLVWELHRALADSAGDTCRIDSTQIRDGVRISKSLRDSYLRRAMLTLLKVAIRNMMQLPKSVQAEWMLQLFPNMIKRVEYEYENISDRHNHVFRKKDASLPDIAYPFIGYRYHPSPDGINDKVLNLPIKNNYYSVRLFEDLIKRDPDEYVYLIDDKVRLVTKRNVLTNETIYLDCLLYPTDIKNQQPTDEVDFEEMHMSNVIALAVVYAKAGSQDEGAEQFMNSDLRL